MQAVIESLATQQLLQPPQLELGSRLDLNRRAVGKANHGEAAAPGVYPRSGNKLRSGPEHNALSVAAAGGLADDGDDAGTDVLPFEPRDGDTYQLSRRELARLGNAVVTLEG